MVRDYRKREFGGFTNFSFIRFPIHRELDELFGEQAAAVTQDVALQFSVHVWLQELQHDGVSCSTDPNLCGLSVHWGWNRNQNYTNNKNKEGIYSVSLSYWPSQWKNKPQYDIKTYRALIDFDSGRAFTVSENNVFLCYCHREKYSNMPAS